MTVGTIILEQRSQGSRIQNVMVFDDIPENAADRLEVADAIRQAYEDEGISVHCATSWEIFGVTFRYNATFPAFSVLVPFTGGPLNGVQSASQANQVALLVSTQFVGQTPNRGRVYFGGLAETALDNDGQFGSLAVNDFVALVEGFRDGIAYSGISGNATLRIATRSFAGTITTNNPVESVLGVTNPSTQRKRRVGVGI